MRQMVYEINRNEVAPSERLSDQVYEIRDGRLSNTTLQNMKESK